MRQVTHKKPFRFVGVDTITILGKPIDGIETVIPFDEPGVIEGELLESELAAEFSQSAMPDLVHVFRSTRREEVRFYVKDGVLLSSEIRQLPKGPTLLEKLKGCFSKQPPAAELRNQEDAAPATEPSVELPQILSLTDDELFDYANDTQKCMLCDWREAPDAVVEYANQFLPDGLQLSYTYDNDGLAVFNSSGRFAISWDDYEAFEEPIPLLLQEINRLIAPSHEARYFNCLNGTDGYSYLLQTEGFWQGLETAQPAEVARVFRLP